MPDTSIGKATSACCFEAAFKRNEMEVLGDCMVGTVPPLSIKVFTADKPRRVADDGTAAFIIQRIVLCAAGKEIVDPLEQKIGWFLMNQGRDARRGRKRRSSRSGSRDATGE